MTVRVDFSGWERLHKDYAYLSEQWPTELSAILGEISVVAKGEVDKVYRHEPNPNIGDVEPSFASGNFGRYLRIHRGGGRVRPWISIGSSVDYAGIVERGGTVETGNPQKGGGNTKNKTPGRKYYGQFADKIYAWAAKKFPNRGPKFADNVIAKIIREGVEGRRVMARALGRENTRFYHFLNFTIRSRVDEFLTQTLAKK